MNRLLFLGVAILLLLSCESSVKNEKEILSFSIDVNRSDPFSHFLEKEYRNVTLETNDDILINEIGKIQFVDSCIYVMDKQLATIFSFTSKGFFVAKYTHRGIGDGEYINLTDFEVFDNKIFILSRASKKIFIYSLDDEYLGDINLGDWYDFFHILDNTKLLLYSNFNNNTQKNLIVFDYKQEKEVNSFFPFDINQNFSFSVTPFNFAAEDEILLTQPYSYDIYSFQDNRVNLKYQLSFNTADQFPKDMHSIPFYDLYTDVLKGKSLVKRIDNIAKTDSSLYLTFVLNYVTNLVKIDLRTQRVERRVFEIIEDCPFAFNAPLLFWKNNVVSVCDAESVLRMENERFPSDKHEDGLLHEDDNPVIIIRKLK